jgi:hypothetical protein
MQQAAGVYRPHKSHNTICSRLAVSTGRTETHNTICSRLPVSTGRTKTHNTICSRLPVSTGRTKTHTTICSRLPSDKCTYEQLITSHRMSCSSELNVSCPFEINPSTGITFSCTTASSPTCL